MDRGAWQVKAHGVTELDMKQLTHATTQCEISPLHFLSANSIINYRYDVSELVHLA